MSYDIHRKCSKCGATPYLDKTVTLHRFPKLGQTNALKLKAWAMYCWPEKDWAAATTELLESLFKKHHMLCGKHFEEYCFTDSSNKRLFRNSVPGTTSDRLAILIKQVLDECCSAGLHVVTTICDLAGANIKALESLGATTENPFFYHQNKEIVTILDPPHLLKCLRNLFMKYDIECPPDTTTDDGNIKCTAKWSHIRNFYSKDKNNAIFVFAPALTEAHVNPTTQQKMRVKLAAQVFSHTVAAGILSRIALKELPAEANGTVSLISKFDCLFDALNADTADLRRGKLYTTNFTNRSISNLRNNAV